MSERPDKMVMKNVGVDGSHTIAVAESRGAYSRVKKALEMGPETIVKTVIESNLRGLGGAGFPAGRKWSFLPKDNPKPVYLVVNADEGEPGTCKDKYVMIHDPHLLIEGIVITCFAIKSQSAFIYVRGEYDLSIKRLSDAIDEARAKGYVGRNIFGSGHDLEIVVHRGAGAYICGEETALLESLEGKRGWPRLKPPFPAVEGYQRCPTVVNNVETISYVPWVIELGGGQFAALGSERNGGYRMFTISGRAKRPGVYELPMGTNLKSMIYDTAGGIIDDRKLKAVIPGGSSSPVLTPDEIDIPMDFDSLAKAGTMAGSAGVIVMDETVSMVETLAVLMRFYAHESCGQCTPCREGTWWLRDIVDRILKGGGREPDPDNLLRIANNMIGTSICPLSEAAAMPAINFVTKFRSEFEEWIARADATPQVALVGIGEPKGDPVAV